MFHISNKKHWELIGVLEWYENQDIYFQDTLITIYKSFVRPHLDYCDIIYDQPNNQSFCNKTERVQYNATPEINGAIRGTSQTKLYNEIGLESLKFRRWMIQCLDSIKSRHLRYLNICII